MSPRPLARHRRPPRTPADVISRLENSIRKTVESQEFTSAAAKARSAAGVHAGAEFSELIAKEDAFLSRLMQQIGLKKSPQ